LRPGNDACAGTASTRASTADARTVLMARTLPPEQIAAIGESPAWRGENYALRSAG
jgi:hypothetical protein